LHYDAALVVGCTADSPTHPNMDSKYLTKAFKTAYAAAGSMRFSSNLQGCWHVLLCVLLL
jgi:hypothetical protein